MYISIFYIFIISNYSGLLCYSISFFIKLLNLTKTILNKIAVMMCWLTAVPNYYLFSVGYMSLVYNLLGKISTTVQWVVFCYCIQADISVYFLVHLISTLHKLSY